MKKKSQTAKIKFRTLGDLSYKTQRNIIIVSFSIIPLLLLLTFSYYPLYRMFTQSFTDWNGLSPTSNFVGLDNYKTIFTDPNYFSVFRVSIYYFVATFFQMGIALYFATILSFEVKFKNFFKGVLFFPYLLNGVAIGFIFRVFYMGGGTLDSVMELFGLGEYIQFWLRDSSIVNISLAATSVWRYMGFNFIIFLGAIQSIPREIYEAAEVDGANRWHQFIYIILPSIKRIVQLNIILAISGAISVFEIPYIMTQGQNRTMTFVMQTLDTAFKFNKVGLASAMGIVLLIIVLIVTLIQKTWLKEEEA